MAITKQTLMTRIRQFSDTLNATADYPEPMVESIASFVHQDEWKKILGAAPYYRTARRSVTTDADGRFTVSSLSTATQNAFRVLQINDGQYREYTYVNPSQVNLLGDLASMNGSTRMWTRVGDDVQMMGSVTSTALTVLLNHTPKAVADITDDSEVVVFPSNYEPILYYESAALLLAKAGREMDDANAVQVMAERLREKMLADLRREVAEPTVFSPTDSPWEWGM